MAHHFAAWHFGGFNLLPFGQCFAGGMLVTTFQCITNTGEVMAELAKTQSDVQHHHVPQHGCRPTYPAHQQPVNSHRKKHGRHNGQPPGHPPMVFLTRIKITTNGHRPSPNSCMHRVVSRQWSGLLQQQGKHDGEETHVQMIPASISNATPMLWTLAQATMKR